MGESQLESARQSRSANLSGARKAAVLLVAIGDELAKEILRSLPESDVELLRYASLLLGLLVVLAFGVRPALRKASQIPRNGGRELSSGSPDANPASLPGVEAEVIDPGRIRAQEIYEQVKTHMKQEPTQSSRLLQSWIHSEGG